MVKDHRRGLQTSQSLFRQRGRDTVPVLPSDEPRIGIWAMWRNIHTREGIKGGGSACTTSAIFTALQFFIRRLFLLCFFKYLEFLKGDGGCALGRYAVRQCLSYRESSL